MNPRKGGCGTFGSQSVARTASSGRGRQPPKSAKCSVFDARKATAKAGDEGEHVFEANTDAHAAESLET